MATQLTIINSLLVRLREDTVSTPTENSYSKLIAQFINDAKADMEDAGHLWSVYINQVDDTILADGTLTYDITETNDRSFLLRKPTMPSLPMAIDITSNETGQLFDVPYSELLARRNLDTNPTYTTEIPKTFAIKSDADGRGFTLELLWGASEARSWRTWWYVPQDDLSTTSDADSSTEILLPRRPIELRALYYALEERGEIMGPRAGSNAWIRSRDAIAAAIETDQQVNKDWEFRAWNNHESL